MAQVSDLFFDLFAYVLLFEQMSLQGGFQPSYDQVRTDITGLLQKQEAEAKRQGLSEQDYREARFAVVAWVDETILQYGGWEHHAQWGAHPLQLEYYQTRNAGEEVFEHLRQLRSEQEAVRDIYYMCLGLGFSGRYALGVEDERTLNHIRHEQAQKLSVAVEEPPDIRYLSPQVYEVTPPPIRPIRVPTTRHLPKIGIALLIALPLLALLVYWFVDLSPYLPDLPPSIVKPKSKESLPASPESALSMEMLRQWLADHPDALTCARVSVDAVEAQTGTVTLGGRVTDETQRDGILNGIREIKGVNQVEETWEMVPRPFCEVLELLEPLKAHADEQAFGLDMQLGKTDVRPVYQQGEQLVIEIRTPKAFASHVYVDYYASDASVGHLFPNPQQDQNAFDPDHTLTIGNGEGQQVLLIAPPPGLELITVIASKTPLFESSRFEPESAEAYISVLRQALDQQPKSDVAATFNFLINSAQP
jgi:type VI secretion system protein ImpK